MIAVVILAAVVLTVGVFCVLRGAYLGKQLNKWIDKR